MKVKLTKTVVAEDCTEQFISPLFGRLEGHFIAKIDENEYAIVNKITDISLVQFESIEKVADNIWILNIADNKKQLIDISTVIPILSEPFTKIIKRFADYVLIEYEDGKRDLIEMGNMRPTNYSMLEEPYSYFKLPNGKYSFVNTIDLTVSKIEVELKAEDFF